MYTVRLDLAVKGLPASAVSVLRFNERHSVVQLEADSPLQAVDYVLHLSFLSKISRVLNSLYDKVEQIVYLNDYRAVVLTARYSVYDLRGRRVATYTRDYFFNDYDGD